MTGCASRCAACKFFGIERLKLRSLEMLLKYCSSNFEFLSWVGAALESCSWAVGGRCMCAGSLS